MIKITDSAVNNALTFLTQKFDTQNGLRVIELITEQFDCEWVYKNYESCLKFNSSANETAFLLRFS
ncbi:MAG: hypothetical protein RLY43_390 [Bacteroidota bacterium]|jgi:hypothetical protein